MIVNSRIFQTRGFTTSVIVDLSDPGIHYTSDSGSLRDLGIHHTIASQITDLNNLEVIRNNRYKNEKNDRIRTKIGIGANSSRYRAGSDR